jgi:predicted nucleic acid-binding protein
VGFGRAAGIYVLSSLRDDPDVKTLSDLQRIVDTTRDVRLAYFCSTQRLSEQARSKIEANLRREAEDKFTIRALGAAQLCEVALVHPGMLEKFYGAEISNCLRSIHADPDDDTELKGLRIALIASAGDDSVAIRREIYCASILDALADKKPRTLASCTKDISDNLQLQRNIDIEAVRPYLASLLVDGFVTEKDGVVAITADGSARIAARQLDAANRLLRGRADIRDALEASIGEKLLDDHFNAIWVVFEERIAEYFMSRGEAIVSEIGNLLGDDSAGSAQGEKTPPFAFLDGLAEAVAATVSHSQRRSELEQAVHDLFIDKTSAATDWLVRLCASYLAACALGLEYSSGLALERLLARTALVFDTDVMLSLVGQGEPDHEAVHTITKRWIQLRGKVLAAEPVLEEGAHHAYIAQRDMDQVRHLIPGTAEDRLHIIENAFVRSFAELIANKRARISQWPTFIGQYRGQSQADWGNLFAHLATEYSIEKLPPRSMKEEELEAKVRLHLLAIAEAKFEAAPPKIARDKASRDAILYAALVHYVRQLKSTDPGATCLIVSSARRLAVAEAKFHESGEPQLVVSISAVLQLLSLVPNVAFGLNAMKAFLFDDRRGRFSSDLERLILRMVRSSQEVSMPWAKRGTLMREVRGRLVSDAEARGEGGKDRRVGKLERDAITPANEGRTIKILAESLGAVAVDTRTAKENKDLRAKVAELERKLQARQGRRA